jgi:hypothetical protein
MAKLSVNVLAHGKVSIVLVLPLTLVLVMARVIKMPHVSVLMIMLPKFISEAWPVNVAKNIGLAQPVICAVILAFCTRHLNQTV